MPDLDLIKQVEQEIRDRRGRFIRASRAIPPASRAGRSTTPSRGPLTLDIHPAHPARGVAGAGGRTYRDSGRYAFDVRRGQPLAQSAQILLEPGNLLGAGDRDDVLALSQQPGQRELRRGALFLRGDRLDAFDEGAVLGQIVAHEARV